MHGDEAGASIPYAIDALPEPPHGYGLPNTGTGSVSSTNADSPYHTGLSPAVCIALHSA
jgi:hypothetical protein